MPGFSARVLLPISLNAPSLPSEGPDGHLNFQIVRDDLGAPKVAAEPRHVEEIGPQDQEEVTGNGGEGCGSGVRSTTRGWGGAVSWE